MFESGDWQFIFQVGVCLGAIIIIVLLIAAIRDARARRAEMAALQGNIRKLSEDMKYLVDAEQRRFLQALKSPKKPRRRQSKAAGFDEQPNEGGSVLTLVPQREGE